MGGSFSWMQVGFVSMTDFINVNCLLIRTVQQIYTMRMHPSEKFHQNLFIKFYLIKDFNFQIQELKNG